MVRATLMTSLDWRAGKDEKHGQYSYRDGDVWYVVHVGPGFSNTHMVTEHDDAGLGWLEGIEDEDLSHA